MEYQLVTALADFGGLPENPLHVGIIAGIVYLSFDLGGQPGKEAHWLLFF